MPSNRVSLETIPVPVSVNLVLSSDLKFTQTPLPVSSNLNSSKVNFTASASSMEASKKVTRSISDECSGLINKNNIEKQVTKSYRIDGRYSNPWETWNENSFRISSLMRFGMSRDNSAVPNQKVCFNLSIL